MTTPTSPPDPHPESAPEVVETHISTLELVGNRVYKRKKPVHFGFVDFSTAAQREAACHREVELNRRLAPTVYLGVAEVLDEHGQPDHAVVMRRMAPADRLATLVAAHDPRAVACVDAVADLVAAFHRGAARSGTIDAAGTAVAVRQVWDDSTVELDPFAGGVLDASVLAEVTGRYRRYLDGRGPLFDARIAGGWVRDGHGDLQAEDVFCTSSGPQILDCIEFDDRLRYADVLADVAFLAMDLERLGARALAWQLVHRWADAIGDPAVLHPTLGHHYVAARAHVRAKVACLRAAQHPPHSHPAEAAGVLARQFLDLCAAHLAAAEVRLVLVGGSPGTGKTTVATALGERLGWEVLHSDMVRKQLAGVDPTRPAPGAGVGDAGWYRPEQVSATYEAMVTAARERLAMGRCVVLDASWTSEEERQRARHAARSVDATVVELRCDCDPSIARERVARRPASAAGGSDATPEVADLLSGRADPWPTAVTIDTSGPPEPALTAALEAVGPG